MSATGIAAVFIVPCMGLCVLVWARVDRVLGGWKARTVRWTGAVVALILSVFTLLAAAGWIAPDAADRLPAAQRDLVEPAIQASVVCGRMPFARVLNIDIDPTRLRTEFSCGIGYFGLFRVSGVSECIGGHWTVGGVLDVYNSEAPCHPL